MEFNTYQSPFTWRYASQEMRHIWSEENKRLLWRKIWVSLAEAEGEFGLVTPFQIDELKLHESAINIPRALEIEAEIHHDLMAELKAYAEQCPLAGGIIHLGATSMDIEDNADALRIHQALKLILGRINGLLRAFVTQIENYSDLPIMAFTHIQPAEPTTLGYRLAMYAQDLLQSYIETTAQLSKLKGKGFKGAVGTAASYGELIGIDKFDQFERILSQKLGLPFFSVSSQTYPRKQDYDVISTLAGIGITLHKFAFDLRLLQSPPIGELNEPFGKHQVGSSAMPFKRNPIHSEKIDSLARALGQMPLLAWQNAANSLLERTLDDSANRRSLLPEGFLICDEILITATKLINGLQVNQQAIQRNFAQYAPFAATERVLMALGKTGADRQLFHEKLRSHAMVAWQSIQNGRPNPLQTLIASDPDLQQYLTPDQIAELMQTENYTGIARARAIALTKDIKAILG